MNSLNAALLVNLVGFAVGAALYGLLAAMVIRHRERGGMDRLLLLTAGLGLIWNVGELFVFVERDFGRTDTWPLVTAAAYSALGFLPSVVVNSVKIRGGWRRVITGGAYAMSIFAMALHFAAAVSGAAVPSDLALTTLTYGALVLTGALLFVNFREKLGSKTIWAAALLIFAASGLHLTGERSESSWFVELVAHQSSLPLAFAILYQNYRFAFADLFLKRSISLLLITLFASGLYFLVAAPLLRYHETHDRNDVQAVSLIIILWVATALVYPSVHRLAVWFVDSVILQRPDYAKMEASIAEAVDKCQSAEQTLDHVRDRLAGVLTAEDSAWRETAMRNEIPPNGLTAQSRDGVSVYVPTAAAPAYEISLNGLGGGRRLLSDETSMMETVALIASRQIDAIRVVHERCEREFREQEFSKLATEAQLAALRAQVNPHFLFNALTTIGYLIQTDHEKAFATLLHLTKLLRGVLNASSEFCTVADELKLIESYLDIERARFEEKLSVEIDVPAELRNLPIPSLILQPLVENAIKHGISDNRNGGRVKISASIVSEAGGDLLELCVADTGPGGSHKTDERPGTGVGLKNVEQRLRSHYGSRSSVTLATDASAWTAARIRLPVARRPARVHA